MDLTSGGEDSREGRRRDHRANGARDENSASEAYDERLDMELHLVQNLRTTMTSLLQVFENARDDLVRLGERMDRVREASEHCRKELAKRQEGASTSTTIQPTKSKENQEDG